MPRAPAHDVMTDPNPDPVKRALDGDEGAPRPLVAATLPLIRARAGRVLARGADVRERLEDMTPAGAAVVLATARPVEAASTRRWRPPRTRIDELAQPSAEAAREALLEAKQRVPEADWAAHRVLVRYRVLVRQSERERET